MKVLIRTGDKVALYAAPEVIIGKGVVTVGKGGEHYRVFNIDTKAVEVVDVPDADVPRDFAPELYVWNGAGMVPTERKQDADAEREADARAEAEAKARAALDAQAPAMLAALITALADPKTPQSVLDWAAAYGKEKAAPGR